jgi:H+-transporting ATPase
VADILIISALALRGIEMQAVSVTVIATVFAAAALFGFVLDFAKVPVFRRLKII